MPFPVIRQLLAVAQLLLDVTVPGDTRLGCLLFFFYKELFFMGKLVVMCARDIKVGAYAKPFFVSTVGQAVRAFGDEAKRKAPDNELANHPEDFELFELGAYDDLTASFELLSAPRFVVRADILLEGG